MHVFVAVAGTPIEATLDLAGVLGQAWQPAPIAFELSVLLSLAVLVVVVVGVAERLLRRLRRDQLRSKARKPTRPAPLQAGTASLSR